MQHVLIPRFLALSIAPSLLSFRAIRTSQCNNSRILRNGPRAGFANGRTLRLQDHSVSKDGMAADTATAEDRYEEKVVTTRPLVPVREQSPLVELLGLSSPNPQIRRVGTPRVVKSKGFGSDLNEKYKRMKASQTEKKIPRWAPPEELNFTDKQFWSLSTSMRHAALRELAEWGHYNEALELANRILTKRAGEAPTQRMYHSLILANASPDGSIDNLLHLMKELETEGIALDQTLCNAILRVLAVHPDYILRTEILQHMERRWFGLSQTGHHMVVASMFRELQLERAIHELQTMKSNNLNIEPWLYTLGIAVLVQVGEFDEAMRVMRLRLEDIGNDRVTALWTHILDAAAEAHHYITCRYIWIRCVKADYIAVSSGTCLKLLNIAARQGDVDFAQDIIRVIKRHHFFMTAEHWELLIETFCNADEIRMAFSTLVDMHLHGRTPNHSSTRPIYMALQAVPEEERDDLCMELYNYLMNQHSMVGRRVPIQAVDVLLESCKYLQSAYDMYQNIRMVCKTGPSIATFHHLFRFTMQEGDARRALKLANEHKLMKLEPDGAIYDGLIMSLLQGKHNMDEIMAIYDEMRAVFELPMFRTMEAVYIALRVRNDSRAPEVFAQLQRREDAFGKGELSVRLQKLRIEAAAQTKKVKDSAASVENPALPFPSWSSSDMQAHIDEVQEVLKTGVTPSFIPR